MMHSIVKFTGIFAGCLALAFFAVLFSLREDALPAFLSRGTNSTVKVSTEESGYTTPDQTSFKSTKPASSSLQTATSSKRVTPKFSKASTTAQTQSKTSPGVVKTTSQPKTVLAPGPFYKDESWRNSETIKATTTVSQPSSMGTLSENEILQIVNSERVKQGLSALTYNATLTRMALTKAKDMIAKQYFAHVSPDGTDVVKLAERNGYDYLNIGENLAMGDFTSSADVMTGWMNSPGHRANILNKSYTEIGISAIQGNYQGRIVWYAVQEFGRPGSLCAKPDLALEQKILSDEAKISSLQADLANLRNQMSDPSLDKETYNAKVADYNNIVNVYNDLAATTKAEIVSYNVSVDQFNACIGPDSSH